MKKLNVTIEQSEDAFFAFVNEIDGCTAGGFSFADVKTNIDRIIKLTLKEDKTLSNKYSEGYTIIYKFALESIFKQFPELNIDVFARQTGIKHSILKAIADGTRLASEEEKDSINKVIQSLATRLQSLRLTR
ncbi:MAG: hypothetical protein ABIQ02_13715 [Saprospiraceae bacterium]